MRISKMEIPNINKKHIVTLLKQNKREGNRGLFEFRNIDIQTGISVNAEGSARVKIGQTDVIAGVKLDVQEPYTDHEDEGTMVTSMEFSPMCGPMHESGPPKIDAIEVARVVDRGVRESGFVDWKKLCIKSGEKVWSISIDIYCINDAGNVLDASAIASIVALKLSRFPKYDEANGSVVYGEFTDTPLPLTENVPFTITFHKIGEKLFVDPNKEEEDTSEARLTLAISKPKKEKIINAMQKGNMGFISENDIDEIIRCAEELYDKMFPSIEKRIEELKVKA